MNPSSRADAFLVEHGYAKTRTEAQEAIEASCVFDGGRPAIKPSQRLNETSRIKYSPAHPFVSCGTLKLAGALNHFDLSPYGLTVLDLGASTGGFSEILLAHGARKIFAVDVGHGKLHPKIAQDPRVTSLEGMNARDLSAKHIAEAPQAIVVDASFISLNLVLSNVLRLAAKDAWMVALVKLQLEVGKEFVGKGGIVKDADARIRALADIGFWLKAQGWNVIGYMDSPVAGGDGNHEFFIAAEKP